MEVLQNILAKKKQAVKYCDLYGQNWCKGGWGECECIAVSSAGMRTSL